MKKLILATIWVFTIANCFAQQQQKPKTYKVELTAPALQEIEKALMTSETVSANVSNLILEDIRKQLTEQVGSEKNYQKAADSAAKLTERQFINKQKK